MAFTSLDHTALINVINMIYEFPPKVERQQPQNSSLSIMNTYANTIINPHTHTQIYYTHKYITHTNILHTIYYAIALHALVRSNTFVIF